MAEGVDTNGDERVKVPSMKPNLFFVSKAFLTRTMLVLSPWWRNKGSSIGDSYVEVVVSAVVARRDESAEAIDEKGKFFEWRKENFQETKCNWKKNFKKWSEIEENVELEEP